MMDSLAMETPHMAYMACKMFQFLAAFVGTSLSVSHNTGIISKIILITATSQKYLANIIRIYCGSFWDKLGQSLTHSSLKYHCLLFTKQINIYKFINRKEVNRLRIKVAQRYFTVYL
jgi:hypothetical protein